MRFDRERYLSLLTFGHTDRDMFVELFGPLVGLEEEWRAQGASAGECSMEDFDWDWVYRAGCGGSTQPRGREKRTLLEETAEYILERDYLGRTVKLPKGMATIPLPLDNPVKTMDDWLRVKHLYTFGEDRIDWDAVERSRKERDAGALVIASIPGAYDTPRELMGDEYACVCYYEQPELMQDIMDTIRETSCKVLERVSQRVTIDQLSVSEDLAGKSGPLVGPRQVDQFFRPYYRAVWDLLKSRGSTLFQIDSDGLFAPIIPNLVDAGINCMIPIEPAAGMDTVALRERYGKSFAMMGGIDKHVLRQSKEAIRRELEYKMQPSMRRGGTVFGLDHRIPNGTPLANYRYYVDLGREILGIPPRSPASKGWQRMAF